MIIVHEMWFHTKDNYKITLHTKNGYLKRFIHFKVRLKWILRFNILQQVVVVKCKKKSYTDCCLDFHLVIASGLVWANLLAKFCTNSWQSFCWSDTDSFSVSTWWRIIWSYLTPISLELTKKSVELVLPLEIFFMIFSRRILTLKTWRMTNTE